MKKTLLFTIMGLLSAFASEAQCTPFSFSFTTTNSSCPNSTDGTADVLVSGGMAPYFYLWSSETTIQTASMNDSLMAGNYSVIVADMMGCVDTGYVTVYATPTSTPSICMVTTDAHSVNNFVYWDQTPYTNVDSFIIYRETSAAVYSRIGAVSSDSLSQFEDTTRSVGPANGDPNAASYRYKIQILDTCGNYGPMSLFHSTIYITDDGFGQFSWALPYTIEGTTSPVTNYVLLCDTANVDVWGPVSSVPGSASAAMDPGFATHGSIANWRVKTAWTVACTPTRATVNTSRSNIKHALAVGAGIGAHELDHSVVVYPNPGNAVISIGLSPDIKTAKISIENMMGQVVYTATVSASGAGATTTQVDVSGYAKGLYLVKMESGGSTAFKKLMVN